MDYTKSTYQLELLKTQLTKPLIEQINKLQAIINDLRNQLKDKDSLIERLETIYEDYGKVDCVLNSLAKRINKRINNE